MPSETRMSAASELHTTNSLIFTSYQLHCNLSLLLCPW